MNLLKTYVLILLCFCSADLFAQSPATIENNLLKSFKKIDNNNDNNTDANDVFAKKLRTYTEKYPSTISQKFSSLVAEHLDISNAEDGFFRIYSWDTWTGGSMHSFESVFQYKIGANTFAVLDTAKEEGDTRPNYYKMYTFKTNGGAYYLAVYRTIGSSKDAGCGIQVFAVENNKLNDQVKLIKTNSGLHSRLYYDYDFFSVVDWKVRPEIYFDAATSTIHLPLVGADGKVTHQYIIYKFTGQYFEKVKN